MSDYEVEYLEEDKEIVQQYLLEPEPLEPATTSKNSLGKNLQHDSLLVEMRSGTKRRARSVSSDYGIVGNADDDDDTDYDPEDDEILKKPLKKKPRKGRRAATKPARKSGVPIKTYKHSPYDLAPNRNKTLEQANAIDKIKNLSGITIKGKIPKLKSSKVKIHDVTEIPVFKRKTNKHRFELEKSIKQLEQASKMLFSGNIQKQKEAILEVARNDPMRKLHDIRFYDDKDDIYISDIVTDESWEKIAKWNDACENFSNFIEKSKLQSCKTVQYLRKICAQVNGERVTFIRIYHETKSDNKYKSFEVVLPHMNCKNPINVSCEPVDRVKTTCNKPVTTILSKEISKEGNVLVAYSPTEFRVTTFEMVEREGCKSKEIRMLMTSQMCVKCYQYSWRGNKDQKTEAEIKCVICSAVFPSAYNLLSHLKNHSLSRHDKSQQNALLSKLMPYHYICRVCKHKFDSILKLREHLRIHKSNEKFFCEVGRHITT